MSDPNAGYPVAAPAAYPPPAPTQTAAPPLTDAEIAEVDKIYAELKPMAIEQARGYVLARTPANLQLAMTDKIAADFPPPAP